MKLTIELSPQSVQILRRLSDYGIFGVTGEEVAARLVDKVLQEMWMAKKITRKAL
jgi:hypothetical protein